MFLEINSLSNLQIEISCLVAYIHVLTKETWCTGDQENGNGILSPAVRVAEDIDIGAIVANAKSSLDQEEREIEHLMTGIIDNEVWVFFFLYIDNSFGEGYCGNSQNEGSIFVAVRVSLRVVLIFFSFRTFTKALMRLLEAFVYG